MPGEMDLVVDPARIGPAAPSLDRRGDGDLTPWRDSGNHLKTVDRKGQRRTTQVPRGSIEDRNRGRYQTAGLGGVLQRRTVEPGYKDGPSLYHRDWFANGYAGVAASKP